MKKKVFDGVIETTEGGYEDLAGVIGWFVGDGVVSFELQNKNLVFLNLNEIAGWVLTPTGEEIEVEVPDVQHP